MEIYLSVENEIVGNAKVLGLEGIREFDAFFVFVFLVASCEKANGLVFLGNDVDFTVVNDEVNESFSAVY